MKRFIFFILMISFLQNLSALDAVVYNGYGQSAENRLTAMTLAGIVNRDEPRLYLLNVYETWSYNQTDEAWQAEYTAQGGVNFTILSDINQLVQHFKPFIKGAIQYDATLTYGNFAGQQFAWQAEAAAMLGGLTDCIPVSSTNTNILIEKPESISVPDHFNGQEAISVSARLHDKTHIWNNGNLTQEQRYFAWLDWALDHLLNRCNTSKFYLREITDWAVGQRMFQLNLAGTDELAFSSLSDEKAAKIERVMSYMKQENPDRVFHVYGWMRPEPLVQWISAWGGSFHETLLSNLSWHHIFPVSDKFAYNRASDIDPETLKLEDKIYMLVIASEGDAGNWVAGFQGGAWKSAIRGDVPVAWGVNLQMFEEFPFIGQYYYRTATPNDGMVAVSTPLGYAYPDVLPESVLPDAKEKTTALMRKFNLNTVYAYKHYNGAGSSLYRGVRISNNFNFANLGDFAQQTGSLLTFTFDPSLQTQRAYKNYGGLIFNHVDDNTFYSDVSNLNTFRDRLISKVKTKNRPYFLLAGYQRFCQDGTLVSAGNNSDITLPRLKTVMNGVKADQEIGRYVEFVTPEKFTYLLRLKEGLDNTGVEQSQTGKSELLIFRQADHIQINVTLEQPKPLTVKIIDVTGRVVTSTAWNMTQESDYLVLSTTTFTQGTYFVVIEGAQERLNAKFLKY